MRSFCSGSARATRRRLGSSRTSRSSSQAASSSPVSATPAVSPAAVAIRDAVQQVIAGDDNGLDTRLRRHAQRSAHIVAQRIAERQQAERGKGGAVVAPAQEQQPPSRFGMAIDEGLPGLGRAVSRDQPKDGLGRPEHQLLPAARGVSHRARVGMGARGRL